MNRQIVKKSQRGGISIIVALMLVGFLSMIALSVDLGRIFVVRNELQNAADSAALSGALSLYPSLPSGGPNWAAGRTAALTAVTRNKADNVSLTTGTVTTGYWDLTGKNSTLTATTSASNTNDFPAVMVTVSKSAGINGGPLSLFFGSVFGMTSVNLSATAISITGSPSKVDANTTFPLALPMATYTSYWDFTTGKPKIDPATGNPYVFNLSEGLKGGWSSYLVKSQDTPTLASYIRNGNPTALSVGDQIWMATGVKNTIYSQVPSNVNAMIAVVSASTPGSYQSIVAFGAVRIVGPATGTQKGVLIYLINDYKLTLGSPGGQNLGVYMLPMLVK